MHKIDFAPSPKKSQPDSEAGCIFENFTPKQGNSLKILVAGTRNHGVSLPPGRPPAPLVKEGIRAIHDHGLKNQKSEFLLFWECPVLTNTCLNIDQYLLNIIIQSQ